MAKRNSFDFRRRPVQYAHIVGWGMSVPESILTNEDLEAILETSDEWIQTRTGIKQRHIANERESTAQLGLKAAQRALAITDIMPGEIDLIIVATSTPENIFPSTASLIQHWLGANNAGAFDLSAACSGFVYGLDMAAQAIRSGSIQTAIVIGAETMSRVMNWQDRGTCILFGDGAGAVVLQGRQSEGGVLATVLRSDGSGNELLGIPTIGNLEIRSNNGLSDRKLHKMYMSGSEVFKFAIRVIGDSIKQVVEQAELTLNDISLVIPHQANARILQAAARSLNMDPQLFMSNLDRYGNTSAASIPIAMCEAIQEGRIKKGDHIVFIGFGGGLTWAASLIRWSVPTPEDRNVNVLRQQQRRAGYAWVRFQSRFRRWRRFILGLLGLANDETELI